MASPIHFSSRFFSSGKTLFEKGAVQEPLFSRGTYQIEVVQESGASEYPFLQMDDRGEITDAFCTCKGSEKGEGCPHLVASSLRIFNGTEEPLHVRFQKSFWSHLFRILEERLGSDPGCLKKKNGSFEIHAKTKPFQQRLHAILEERKPETEETSIKFSNLSFEEIAMYRKGMIGPELRFELSFWSDLAKWCFALVDEKKEYEISFAKGSLPKKVQIRVADLSFSVSLQEEEWPHLIESLATVQSPLEVMEEKIQSISFDSKRKSIVLKKEGALPHAQQGKRVGEWLFVPQKGFYRIGAGDLFLQERIGPDEIGPWLNGAHELAAKFFPIDPIPRQARYSLWFDPGFSLHIQLYLFEEDEMEDPESEVFFPWIFLPKKGFFRLSDWFFQSKKLVIPKEEMASFINRSRVWLHQFPSFRTHLGSLESHLVYEVNGNRELCFEAKLDFPEEGLVNFDEWAYIPGQGFFMKKESRGHLPVHPGLKLSSKEVGPFIASHAEALKEVEGFFSSQSFLVRMGLKVELKETGRIFVSPQWDYAEGIDPEKVVIFGDSLYLEGHGFLLTPLASRLPERYRFPVEIPKEEESRFLSYELDALSPLILSWDLKLQEPSMLRLEIRKMTKERKKEGGFLVEMAYVSTAGETDLFTIWDAMAVKAKFCCSNAGLLTLKHPRFSWIRQLAKKKLDRKKGKVRLSTLDWLRLQAFEEISPNENVPEIEAFSQTIHRFETNRLIDLSHLKSKLRPYQEEGVQWLWFLYCHGLSGLLSDEMGLGKTHQAMALLASVIHEDLEQRNRYLVVCPTSVIYHWQDLLARFLPEINVSVYYGIERSFKEFEEKGGLLLTSYGILRSSKEDFRSLSFEVAIFDEIQTAKNSASQTHKALRLIKANMRLGLTGTPIENRLKELKALFDVILPSYMPPDALFRDLFLIPIEKQNDVSQKKLLSKLVKPFILRRRKKEVLFDLPEKIEEIAYCDLSEEQTKLYREVSLDMKQTLLPELKDFSKPIAYLHVFSALTRMKRICDHPALVLSDVKGAFKHSSGKWDLFVELLEEALGSEQKVVIFSQYLEMIAIIEEFLSSKEIGFASIKGSTRDREGALRQFREDPSCQVFVASLLAAGVGIDLTVASIVIHYDRWWNPAKENQATDRVHRIGQNRGVQVFKLVTKGTIEERIHEIIEKKQGLLEDVIGEGDQITYLSREELIDVFEKINP